MQITIVLTKKNPMATKLEGGKGGGGNLSSQAKNGKDFFCGFPKLNS